MKAVWTDDDYAEMRVRPLPFTAWDVTLIRNGLAVRAGAR